MIPGDQIIQMKNNRAEVSSFIERFSGKVDYVSVTNICAASGDEKILKHSLLEYNCSNKFPCTEIWRRLSISWNGDVTVCCQDYDFELKIGSLLERDIARLWHSRDLNDLRDRHKQNDFEGLLCQTCTANCKANIIEDGRE